MARLKTDGLMEEKMGLGNMLGKGATSVIQNGAGSEIEEVKSCDVIFLLDQSISMEQHQTQAMKSFNKFLDDQRKVPGTTRMTLGLFSDTFEVVKKLTPIKMMPGLSKENYEPDGSTALLDAIGISIGETMMEHTAHPADRPASTIFVILSDGGENASTQYSRPTVKSMIDRARRVFDWEFLVIAIGSASASEIAKDLGIEERFALSTGDSVRGAFEAISKATTEYRRDGKIKLLAAPTR